MKVLGDRPRPPWWDDSVWPWVGAVLVAVCLILWTIKTRAAEPALHTITFENPGPGLTTSLEVCWQGSCMDYPVPCEAGQVCTVEAPLSYGCGELVVAAALGTSKQKPGSVQYCVAGRERFDVNGDGEITVLDFAMGFLRAFQGE